jgi:hypothetical protein
LTSYRNIPVASIDPLPLPFASWQEGLFALAEALSDRAREKIIVAHLEATAAKNPLGLKEICALALLVPFRSTFTTRSSALVPSSRTASPTTSD